MVDEMGNVAIMRSVHRVDAVDIVEIQVEEVSPPFRIWISIAQSSTSYKKDKGKPSLTVLNTSFFCFFVGDDLIFVCFFNFPI